MYIPLAVGFCSFPSPPLNPAASLKGSWDGMTGVMMTRNTIGTAARGHMGEWLGYLQGNYAAREAVHAVLKKPEFKNIKRLHCAWAKCNSDVRELVSDIKEFGCLLCIVHPTEPGQA